MLPSLRVAKRANAEVRWTVSIAVERLVASTAAAAAIFTSTAGTVRQHCSSSACRQRARANPAARSTSTIPPSGTSSPRNLPMPDVAMSVPEPNPNPNLNLQYSQADEADAMPAMPKFSFADYDCVGFDLDNTICRYKVSNMVKMEYEALSSYLIANCGYSPKYLSLPIEKGVEFMIKGLILDVKKGNILRIAPCGRILHGSHGTKELSKQELITYYGPEMRWEVTDIFIKDPLHTWNGPHSETMRTLSDYFDMPASLVFARAVDTLDEANNGQALNEYAIYPHIQQALQDMFQKEHFGIDKGGYFPNIKSNPDNYIHKCSAELLNWFRELKQANKLLFLITGSNVDFATHTATKSLGANWQDIFDIVICFAKKPGFFTQQRAFKALDGFVETHEVAEDDLQRGHIYTSGNWDGVHKFLKKASGKEHPKIVYIGDHLIQDVYTPSAHTDCDAVAVCEELEAEGVFGHDKAHHDDGFLLSTRWGSYFHHNDEENVWTYLLRKHAKLVVPSLEYVAKHPICHQFPSMQ